VQKQSNFEVSVVINGMIALIASMLNQFYGWFIYIIWQFELSTSKRKCLCLIRGSIGSLSCHVGNIMF
jgi:hypothetical protein